MVNRNISFCQIIIFQQQFQKFIINIEKIHPEFHIIE